MAAKESILIVDDERNIRVTLRDALEDAGYTVELAADGAAALAHVEGRPYDLILLDLKLPDLDGLDVLTRARAIRPDALVVVITAHGTVDAAVTAMKRGARDLLQKPFTPSQLRDVVSRALRAPREVAGDYDATLARARAAVRRGHLEAGTALAHAALALNPERADALCLCGAILEFQREFSRAQSLYRAAVALDATFAPARTNLSRSTGQVHDLQPLLGDEEEP
ncbi:MAG: hypothetical protein AMXMBFR64_17670 [Myxococcales bacterium]